MPQFNPDDINQLVSMGRFSPTFAQQISPEFRLQQPVDLGLMAPVSSQPMAHDVGPYGDVATAEQGVSQGLSPFLSSEKNADRPIETIISDAQKKSEGRAQSLKGLGKLKNYGDVLSRGRAANQTEADTATDLANASSIILKRASEEQAKIAQQYDAKIKYYDNLENQEIQKQNSLRTSIENYEINPNRLLQGERGFIAAIASALGAFGAGLTGGSNQVNDMIQRAVDRDVRAQEIKLDNLKESFNMGRITFQQYESILQRIPQDRAGMIALSQSKAANALQLLSNSMTPGKAQADAVQKSNDLFMKVREQQVSDSLKLAQIRAMKEQEAQNRSQAASHALDYAMKQEEASKKGIFVQEDGSIGYDPILKLKAQGWGAGYSLIDPNQPMSIGDETINRDLHKMMAGYSTIENITNQRLRPMINNLLKNQLAGKSTGAVQKYFQQKEFRAQLASIALELNQVYGSGTMDAALSVLAGSTTGGMVTLEKGGSMADNFAQYMSEQLAQAYAEGGANHAIDLMLQNFAAHAQQNLREANIKNDLVDSAFYQQSPLNGGK